MYTVKKGARVATVDVNTELGGDAEKIVFSDYYRIFSIKNKGTNTMYVSLDEAVIPGMDGTYELPPNVTLNIAYVLTSNFVKVQGEGTVIVSASNTYVPFYEENTVQASGEGTVEETTNEDVDNLFVE